MFRLEGKIALVTGAAGTVGLQVIRFLLSEGKYEITEEVIINPVQNKGTKEFNDLLDVSLTNIYNSLKQ